MTSKHFFISIIVVLLVAGACFPSMTFAQNLKFRLPLTVADSGAKIATQKLTFGLHPNATTCIDPGPLTGFVDRWSEADSNIVREFEGPPPSPSADFRFSYPSTICGSSPFVEDIHKSTSSTQIDTFRFNVQVDNTSGDDLHSIKFYWPKVLSEYADSVLLVRSVGAAALRFRVNITQLDSFIIPNYSIGLYGNKLLGNFIILKNPKTPPGAPTVTTTAPPNNATDVSLTPTFSWNAVAGAKYYKFKLAKDTFFLPGANLVRKDSLPPGTTSLNQVTSLQQNTTYYWRLNVANQYGYSYDQSPPLKFTTLATFPEAPVPISPLNNATEIPVSGITLTWRTAVSSLPILSYHVQMATDSSFSGGSIVVNDSTITDTTYATGVLGNCVKYYWRVSAKNSSGAGPYFSPARKFRVTLAAPAAPTLTSPPDGGTNIAVSPTLSWTGDACSDSYRLEVAWDAGFTQIVADQTLNLTSSVIGPLVDDTVYFWRVTAMNAGPFTGPASATRSFRTVILPPPVPTLISPANDATISLPPSAFVWSSSRKATTYRFDISKNSNFSTLLYVDSTHADTTNIPAGLQNCQVYYWRVRAKNSAGASLFAPFRVFHGQRALPGNPSLLEPAHGAGGIGENTTLKWSASDSCIASYILNVSTNIDGSGNPSAPFFLKETLSATQRTIGPLTAFTRYYWRVQGRNEMGASAGDTSSFVVASTAPPAPSLVFPTDGLGGISVSPTLVWDTSARATKYRLQVSYNAGFTLLAVNDSTITQPASAQVSKQVGPLPNTTTFFWRVIASNASGAGSPSAVYSFSTLSPPLAPTLIAPACGATDVSVLPTFFWTISDGAQTYRLQVSSDSIFSLIVFDDSTIVTTTKQITNLLKSTTKYYWRVRAKNSAAPGPFTPVCSFTTQRTGQANWALPISICETGPACDTIFLGINPNATYGIDAPLGEYELPQSGQFGWFDARWIDNVSPSRIGEGLRFNLHGFRTYTQVDTFRLKFQPGTGSYPMKISWRRAYVVGLGDSMVIKDEFGGTTYHARMDLDSTISITNSVVSTMLVISYGAFPLDVKPVDIPELPKGFMLAQNYPNPFNPTTRVRFSTDERADIRITVYDVLGREITRLANSTYEPGAYEVEWDGRSDQGLPTPSGIYYLRMIGRTLSGENGGSAPFTMMRKMIMMK